MGQKLDQQIYSELKRIANKLMSKERDNHTLSPTDLVHEAYARLPSGDDYDHASYIFVLARQMRHLLVDYGRKKSSIKGGGQQQRVLYTDALGIHNEAMIDFSLIHDAIETLGQLDARAAQAIDLYYFTQISRQETADLLKVSIPTLERDLRFAKAHINHYLKAHG